MKKITLFLLFALLSISTSVNAQIDYYGVITGSGTSGNGRAPQALDRCDRSVWLITAAEMAASGFVSGDVISSIGFNYLVGADVPASGTLKVYFSNTTSATNALSTAWATAITGMTMVSSSTITIPAAAGTVDYPFSGGSAFSYTGGGLYIATDYQNLTGTVATAANTALCSTALTNGLKGARTTTTTPPTTLTASTFRPETRLGKTVPCSRPVNVAIPSSTLTTANLTFTSSNPVNAVFGPYDFNPTTTGTPLTGISSPYTITGLTASTAYEIYTKSDCGSFVGLSAFTDPISFHTTFQPANPSYNTSFEVDNYPNMGWTSDPDPNGSSWRIIYGGTGSALVQDGLYAALSVANSTSAANSTIYSRGVNLQAGSLATVSFYVLNYLNASTSAGSYVLTVGNTQDAAGQTTTIATEPTVSNTAYALKTYTFTPATSGVYYFGILNNSPSVTAAETQALLIDNFTVSQTLANDQFLDSKFSTYPNPAKNVINVSNTMDAMITAIEFTDVNGRIVKNVKFDGVSETQISVSELSSGIYMMKIVSDKGIITKKVIKE